MDAARRDAGAEILRLTDEIGFCAVGAAWVYSHEADIWSYALVTPMLDSKGPRWIFDRLLKVFQKLPLPAGVTPLDLRVVSPQEDWFRRFPVKARSMLPGDIPSTELRNIRVPGMTEVDYAYMYRMDPRPQFAGERARIFDRRVQQLLAA